jgi:hypothetical protein
MKRLRLCLLSLTIAAAFDASAQEAAAPATAIALPSGLFGSWPAEAKDQALLELRARCASLAIGFIRNYRGPMAAGRQEAAALGAACVAKAMPDDWPGLAAEQIKSEAAYANAKHLDPNVPDPARLAEVMAKNAKGATAR